MHNAWLFHRDQIVFDLYIRGPSNNNKITKEAEKKYMKVIKMLFTFERVHFNGRRWHCAYVDGSKL